ncbi:MAG: GTPase domain-containing protein [Gemmataceae bacterium]|nr:GTPase domain-containing protein [Gemmataceae bacterium]
MSALTPSPRRLVAIDPNALRVVLFGMPSSGKTSLLGALAQAAHLQARTLRGQLIDPSGGLGEIRRWVYEARPSETLEEIVHYPVSLNPFNSAEAPYDVTLLDCDGRVANDLLQQKQPLKKTTDRPSLAGAILDADALILVVDAAASVDQLEDDFREFLSFLDHLVKHRAQRHSVGGLPVYLVLNKCDVFAHNRQMTRSQWEDELAARKADVGRKFREYLATRVGRSEFSEFGSVDLRVVATTAFRPILADSIPNGREPYGVAELFHDCFERAREYRSRTQRASKRLFWTATGASSLLGAMLIAGVALLISPPLQEVPPPSGALSQLEKIRATEGSTTAQRLGAGLDRRLKEWVALRDRSDFHTLSEEQKQLVQLRIEEGEAYTRFRDEVNAVTPPSKTGSLDNLKKTEERLLSKAVIPAIYRSEWQSTEAAIQRERMLNKEIPALREGVSRLRTHFNDLQKRINDLLFTSEISADWDSKALQVLDDAEKKIPFTRSDPVYGAAYNFYEVDQGEADFTRSRVRLKAVREIVAATGLLGNSSAPLDLSAPSGNKIVEQARIRMASLKQDFPDYKTWMQKGIVNELPDAIQKPIKQRLQRSRDQFNRDGQRLISDVLAVLNPGGGVTAADWPRIGEYLMRDELKDWRELGEVLYLIEFPNGVAPVEAAAEFFKKESFTLDFKTVEVRIPDRLTDAIVRPDGPLTIVHRSAGVERTIDLAVVGTGERNGQIVSYKFKDAKADPITFKPGDTFYCQLKLKKGDRSLALTWVDARTSTYAIDAFTRLPYFHDATQKANEGVLAEGVILSLLEGSFPNLPRMIPDLRK